MRKSNMLKVLIAFFLILILVFLLSVFFKVQSNKNETYISNNVITDSNDAKKLIQYNDNVVIYFSQKNCVYCKELNI